MPAKSYETMAKILKGAITGSLEKNGLTDKQQATLRKKISSLSQLQEELEEISREFKKFHIDKKTKRLVACTGDAIAGGKNFGPFEIQVELLPTYRHYNKPRLGWRVFHSVKALEPRLPLYERLRAMAGRRSYGDGFTHPHIAGDSLCTGTRGSQAIKRAAKTFRIADIFFLLNSVLNGYSEMGSHCTVDEWKTLRCYSCENIRGIRGLYVCVNCGDVYCRSCVGTFCGEKGCKSCICKHCAPHNKGSKLKARCKVHKKVIGRSRYQKPSTKKTTKGKKDKFNGLKGWSL